MRRNAASLLIVMLIASAPAVAQDAGPPAPAPPSGASGVARAEALLAEVAAAYQAAPVYSDRVTVSYSHGGTPRQPFEASMLLGRGTDARIVSGGNTVTAVGGKMVVEYPRYPDRYLEVPLEVDVVTTLTRLFGRYGGPMAPAAFRYGKPTSELIRVLGYGLPDTARISGYREITTAEGEPRQQISLISATGSVAVNIDPGTKFIDTIALEYVSADAPVPNFRVTLDLAFHPEVHQRLPEPINFVPDGRMAFSRRAAMTGQAFPENLRHVKVKQGEPALDFSMHTLEGAKVALADLRGSVAVLCFWTRNNDDAQAAMHTMQELSDWAQASALPVEVWPVHTLGQGGTSEIWESTLQYWERHPFTIMSLIDEDDVVAGTYGITGVPMVVVIDREGKVAGLRSGLPQINADEIKKDILGALGLPASGS